MKSIKIPDEEGFYSIIIGEDYEYQNPLEQISRKYCEASVDSFLINCDLKSILPTIEDIEQASILAAKDWIKEKQMYLNFSVNPVLFNLVETKSKKDQIKLLRGLSISFYELTSFFCQIGETQGNTHSFYRVEFIPKNINKNDLPVFAERLEDNSIKVIGATELSAGQLKGFFKQRNMTIAQFIENGEEWHCFFYKTKSMNGEENYMGNQPHLHYISDKWNIPREEFLYSINQGWYKGSSCPHILIHKDE